MATSSRRITITNPTLHQGETSILDTDYTSGTVLTVVSNSNISLNQIAVIEGLGVEKAESQPVSSTSGSTTVTLNSAYSFSHNKGALIAISEFDQIEVSKMPSGGSWSVLDTVSIQWDKPDSVYIDTGGLSTDSYRFRFKNSASGNFSEYSPTVSGGGFANNQIGHLVRIVQRTINDPDEKVLSVEDIINIMVEAKQMISGTINDWWFWKKEDKGTITTEADKRSYSLDAISTTIEYVKDVRFLDTVSGSTNELYPLEHLQDALFDLLDIDQSEDTDDRVLKYNITPPDDASSSGYIRVDPVPKTTSGGSFYVRYYRPDEDYDDVADTTDIPFPVILTYLPIAEGLRLKGQETRASLFEDKFYGPPSTARDRRQLTGIALLQQHQIGKGRALGQPKSLKQFVGRRGSQGLYNRMTLERDTLAEDYFDYPVK